MKPEIDALIPPSTNPDVGKPTATRKAAKASKTRISGSDLVPNLEQNRELKGVNHSSKYWVGVTPSCPVEHIDICGINFPKVNELIVDDPMRTSVKKRVPVIGSVVELTAQKIQMMRERLPRTVIRFLDDQGVTNEPGTGQNIGDNHVRPKRGHVITIPTDAEIEERRKKNKGLRTYTPSKNDVPAARFMFAVLCEDQERGSRGDFYPDVLETTGLEWPDELK